MPFDDEESGINVRDGNIEESIANIAALVELSDGLGIFTGCNESGMLTKGIYHQR